ncbi:IclR family transcriptional regulator [Rhodococcus sp. BP-349]|uniref:IclR family transcriptional regulator n=1 Tax=unclassified Rhodococcus (in: high G+C Gram-positive bacteria) TaxID=192944 RepID=UPI001C922559|nr:MULTISPECIES: IclR family transcriptional regulator [unclassified Rhodococcus (in: high G+C Gram-positive bacteria)]MBY3985658.1 IclR family transcriptional regulator [Rhodococcus fascians]MBY3995198.1 IclR family transcriptional regulator [Rhodococcus fascians]MBY4000482.1 IclR family transcriptional regulator [Rhodococcus fascians]MBY4005510.1 IclR family transcriptional regulator [Rhodococcus fascians]MBY4016343.1 IclR family transcriptional regulator [Rhodococcus fascians]
MESRPGTTKSSRIDAVSAGSGAESRLVGSDRVLAVLKDLARFPDGASLDELTQASGSPKPTVHRALSSLRRAGLADQDGRGKYLLGDEVLRMAFAFHEARPEHLRMQPVLEALSDRFGETTHYAVLDGREVVYRAKVDPGVGSVRLTSMIGGRNPAHATGVGKMLLACRLRTRSEVKSWVGSFDLVRRTPNTLCTVNDLHDDFAATRERGFSIDDQENEMGINCVSLPVYSVSSSVPSGALSISALAYRTPLSSLLDAMDEIKHMTRDLTSP